MNALRPLVAGALLALAAVAAAAGPRGIDTASISVGGERVRLFGVAAPDPEQTCEELRDDGPRRYPCGQHARAFLQSLVAGREPVCVRESAGSATCYVDGTDVGLAMVEAGWAVARRDESVRYLRAQDAARAAGRGLWLGSFDDPTLPAARPRR